MVKQIIWCRAGEPEIITDDCTGSRAYAILGHQFFHSSFAVRPSGWHHQEPMGSVWPTSPLEARGYHFGGSNAFPVNLESAPARMVGGRSAT